MKKSCRKSTNKILLHLLAKLEKVAEKIVADSDNGKDIMLYGEIVNSVYRIKKISKKMWDHDTCEYLDV